jgi:lysyl-tRNA synthetase class 2
VGLHALYVGDEAIVHTAAFSLEGRAVRKLRQAVSRLEREGYSAEVQRVAALSAVEMDELQSVSDRWRAGEAERGFSMALEGLAADPLDESLVVVARDTFGRARGFLHFVPAYGRPVMSLSAMRRDRDAPNGITEFLVASAVRQLAPLGIEELSLNFAAFARWLHSPSGRVERVLKVLLGKADDFFQVESLYRFNAKFRPRWQPRYLLYQGATSLPRTALAALWAEGQIPRPALPAPLLRRVRPVTA